MPGLRNYKPSTVRSTVAQHVKLPLTEGAKIGNVYHYKNDMITMQDSTETKGIFSSSESGFSFILEKSNTCQQNDPTATLDSIANGKAIPGCVINIKNLKGDNRGQIVSNGDGKTSKDVPIGQSFYYKDAKNPSAGGVLYNSIKGVALDHNPVEVIEFKKGE